MVLQSVFFGTPEGPSASPLILLHVAWMVCRYYTLATAALLSNSDKVIAAAFVHCLIGHCGGQYDAHTLRKDINTLKKLEQQQNL